MAGLFTTYDSLFTNDTTSTDTLDPIYIWFVLFIIILLT
jgi:hypothetical protein